MAVKLADVDEAATMIEAGTVKFVVFEESATDAPPEGAALLSVTVHLSAAQDCESTVGRAGLIVGLTTNELLALVPLPAVTVTGTVAAAATSVTRIDAFT